MLYKIKYANSDGFNGEYISRYYFFYENGKFHEYGYINIVTNSIVFEGLSVGDYVIADEVDNFWIKI